MCGIVGQLNYSQLIEENLFHTMRDTLQHRGPDGSGSAFFQAGHVALGHRRLSIIDLSDKGKQPMSNEDGTIWVTFNGEIYNYPELKEQLERVGHHFQSNTDTEVLVHGYEEWGKEMLRYLKGMFAFGIWDDREKALFLARDRFGIKPLYYYPGNNHFIFASELKAILANPSVPRQLNSQSVANFFVYRSIPAPQSIWQGIFKLPPAHYLYLKKGSLPSIRPYWQIEPNDLQMPTSEVRDKVEALLSRAVQEHLISDVPVGLFLSGGFDSSTLAWQLSKQGHKVQSFTIGFKNWNLSEHQSAQLAADHFGTNHTTQFVDGSIFGRFDQLVYYFDEPLGGTSLLPTFELARLAAKNVKVVLAGDGGDEVFAGYKWHQSYFYPWYEHPRQKIKHFFNGETSQLDHYKRAMNWTNWRYTDLRQLFSFGLQDKKRMTDPFFSLEPNSKKDVKPLQLLDFKYFLPEVVLHKVDRASMAHSLEVRVPFLDHELVEFMIQLNSNSYFRKGVNKHLLQEVVKMHFPPGLLQKPKKGFGMSVKHFFEQSYFPPDWRSASVFADQILNSEFVQILINQKEYEKLWSILIFMIWYEKWH